MFLFESDFVLVTKVNDILHVDFVEGLSTWLRFVEPVRDVRQLLLLSGSSQPVVQSQIGCNRCRFNWFCCFRLDFNCRAL